MLNLNILLFVLGIPFVNFYSKIELVTKLSPITISFYSLSFLLFDFGSQLQGLVNYILLYLAKKILSFLDIGKTMIYISRYYNYANLTCLL